MEWAKATHNLQKPPYGWKDKWDTYFKNMGEFLDFQKIQKAESISANHPRTLRKIEWLKEKDTSLWKEVTLRSYCALFDLSNQHGSATQAAKTAFEAAIKSKKPSSQLGMVEHFITEVAKHPKTDWIKDSIGRREGILKGEPTGNKDWNKVANPMLKKYLNPDKSIKGL